MFVDKVVYAAAEELARRFGGSKVTKEDVQEFAEELQRLCEETFQDAEHEE